MKIYVRIYAKYTPTSGVPFFFRCLTYTLNSSENRTRSSNVACSTLFFMYLIQPSDPASGLKAGMLYNFSTIGNKDRTASGTSPLYNNSVAGFSRLTASIAFCRRLCRSKNNISPGSTPLLKVLTTEFTCEP